MARHKSLFLIGYLILRVAAAGLSPVPGAVPVDPLPVLLALWMRDRTHGDHRALLFLPVLILGDLLAGMSFWTLMVRGLMLTAFALSPVEGEFHRRSWAWTFTYWFGTAVLVDLQGWMPLGFVTLVGVLQGFLWWGLLSPRAGGGPLFAYGSLIGPPLALLAIHLLLPSPALWPFPSVGTHSSNWVRAFALLVFLEPVALRVIAGIGTFLPRRDLCA